MPSAISLPVSETFPRDTGGFPGTPTGLAAGRRDRHRAAHAHIVGNLSQSFRLQRQPRNRGRSVIVNARARAGAVSTLVAAGRTVVASVCLAVTAAGIARDEVRPQRCVECVVAVPRAVPGVHRRPVERMAYGRRNQNSRTNQKRFPNGRTYAWKDKSHGGHLLGKALAGRRARGQGGQSRNADGAY